MPYLAVSKAGEEFPGQERVALAINSPEQESSNPKVLNGMGSGPEVSLNRSQGPDIRAPSRGKGNLPSTCPLSHCPISLISTGVVAYLLVGGWDLGHAHREVAASSRHNHPHL